MLPHNLVLCKEAYCFPSLPDPDSLIPHYLIKRELKHLTLIEIDLVIRGCMLIKHGSMYKVGKN